MNQSKKYNVAVIGATGNAGRKTLEILAERCFPIENIYAVASDKSIGKEVSFGDRSLKILTLDYLDFSTIDIAFFSAGSAISQKYVPIAIDLGCIVIDKSSHYRMDSSVPLIVPEANIATLTKHISAWKGNNSGRKGFVIANPNCCSIILAAVLKPINNISKIKRLVISTYQSVAGAGKEAMDELYNQTKAKYMLDDYVSKIFPKQIAFNIFPHIGDFLENASTSEESKIENELRKIINDNISIDVTCVRVPVFLGHCMSVNIEFAQVVPPAEIEEILSESDGIIVHTSHNDQKYLCPIDIADEDSIYVSRIRKNNNDTKIINLWVASDNIRKGAGLNAVQIAEELIKHL